VEVPVIKLSISGLLGYFPYLLFIFSTCNLCSQVKNSSTAQVGGPHDAADVVEPVLAGSDVPLPEDGFTHEVNCYLPYFESRIFNAFSFQALDSA
jgi:hypothetical protein